MRERRPRTPVMDSPNKALSLSISPLAYNTTSFRTSGVRPKNILQQKKTVVAMGAGSVPPFVTALLWRPSVGKGGK